MNGTARQEVAFAATLLRGAAHEWYMGYEQRNGNQPPRDWPTMMQAILERFGSNIRAQEAQAKLLTISQGKRSVREYTSEFETLLGRMPTRDEATWKNMYVWGLQPHLARTVALKYPTTIAQAAGHAEETELAIKASQRPTLGGQGARTATENSGRGGSQIGPRTFIQVEEGITLELSVEDEELEDVVVVDGTVDVKEEHRRKIDLASIPGCHARAR